MSKINFAIVGCGHIGKRHAEMVKKNPSSELVAMADTSDRSLLSLENINPEIFFHSIEELLKSNLSIDVVTIASPNGLHAQQALECLNAGKHVVVEKPLTLTKSDAEAIIHKALDVQRNVFVVMQNRYSPPAVWLKELMEQNKLGRIFMVEVNCYWNRDERYYKNGRWQGNMDLDGGTLFTQFSHFIDMMYWLFGDIKNIQSRFNNFNHKNLIDFEDSGFITFDFESGGMGCFNYSTAVWDKNMESSLTIIAENGTVKVGGQYMDKIEYCHVKDYEPPQSLPLHNLEFEIDGYKGAALNHWFVIQNVVDVLLNGKKITTNAMDGLKVVDIIERIYRSN